MLPAIDNLLPIAQVLKSYGTEGEVLISFLSAMPDDINLEEPVFLIAEGLPVPFFMENIEFRGTTKALVKFEDIDSLKEAEEIVGQKLHYPSQLCYNDSSESVLGYTLFDQNGDKVGIITEMHDFGGNVCVEIKGKLIPLHEDLVLKIDPKRRTLQINIPSGL